MEHPIIRIVRSEGRGDDDPALTIDGTTWRLEHEGLEGFDGVAYEVSTGEYAQYDGAYLTAERSPARDRTITMLGMGDQTARRREAERFFVARRSYEVHVVNGTNRRYFTGRQYALSIGVDNWTGLTRVTWTCLALDPFLASEESSTGDIAAAEGRFGFPFLSWRDRVAPAAADDRADDEGAAKPEFHVAGFVVGVASHRVRMENDGHVAVYPRIDITVTGPVSNPRFSFEDRSGATTASFGFRLAMKAGDHLVVDFTERPTAVTLNGASVLNTVTAGSDLTASIEPGEFAITWGADSGDASMSVVPTIRERYVTI